MTIPSALVGTWKRRITAADERRFGTQGEAGSYAITITHDGRIKFGPETGTITPSGTRLIRIDFGLVTTPPLVTWKVSGRVLTLYAVRAPDNLDRMLWTGKWRRR